MVWRVEVDEIIGARVDRRVAVVRTADRNVWLLQKLMYGAYVLLIIDCWIPVTPPRNVELALLIHAIKSIVAGLVKVEKESSLVNISFQPCFEFSLIELRTGYLIEIVSITRVTLKFLKLLEQLFDAIADYHVAIDQILVEVREDGFGDSSIGSEMEENCTSTKERLIVCSK